jgi:hypothetical protein
VQLARQRRAGGTRACQAIGAGAGVGVTSVHHHGADGLATRQMLAADLHRRGAKAVLRKHARHRAAFVQQEHREVLAVGLAHAGFGNADAHACHRVQISRIGSGEMNGHGVSFQKLGR